MEASFPLHLKDAAMHNPDLWTESADAMELIVEGERLITRAMVQKARDLRYRFGRALAAMLSAENRHLPPI
jgi:hypothetical protein